MENITDINQRLNDYTANEIAKWRQSQKEQAEAAARAKQEQKSAITINGKTGNTPMTEAEFHAFFNRVKEDVSNGNRRH